MSFILDALNKDQSNQATGANSELAMSSRSRRPNTPSKRWGLWAIGAGLFVNAGLVAWYLSTSANSSSQTPQVAASNPGASRTIAVVPRRPAPRADISPQPQAETRTIPKRTPVRQAAPPPARPSPKPKPRASAKPVQPSSGGRVLSPAEAERLGIDFGASSSQPTTPAAAPATTPPTTPATNPAPVASSPPSPAQTATGDRVPSAQIITVDELPTAARGSFPELEFSTHIFADDPSMRAIVVNDQRLTEGEQMGELVLRSVTEDGVVFGYRSYLVAVSVVEQWAQ